MDGSKSPGSPSGPSRKRKHSSSENECVICLDTPEERGKISCCDHIFCFSCITKWAKVTNCCPLCKATFSKVIKTNVAGEKKAGSRVRNIKNKQQKVWYDSDADVPEIEEEPPAAGVYQLHVSFVNLFGSILHDSDEDDDGSEYEQSFIDDTAAVYQVPDWGSQDLTYVPPADSDSDWADEVEITYESNPSAAAAGGQRSSASLSSARTAAAYWRIGTAAPVAAVAAPFPPARRAPAARRQAHRRRVQPERPMDDFDHRVQLALLESVLSNNGGDSAGGSPDFMALTGVHSPCPGVMCPLARASSVRVGGAGRPGSGARSRGVQSSVGHATSFGVATRSSGVCLTSLSSDDDDDGVVKSAFVHASSSPRGSRTRSNTGGGEAPPSLYARRTASQPGSWTRSRSSRSSHSAALAASSLSAAAGLAALSEIPLCGVAATATSDSGNVGRSVGLAASLLDPFSLSPPRPDSGDDILGFAGCDTDFGDCCQVDLTSPAPRNNGLLQRSARRRAQLHSVVLDEPGSSYEAPWPSHFASPTTPQLRSHFGRDDADDDGVEVIEIRPPPPLSLPPPVQRGPLSLRQLAGIADVGGSGTSSGASVSAGELASEMPCGSVASASGTSPCRQDPPSLQQLASGMPGRCSSNVTGSSSSTSPGRRGIKSISIITSSGRRGTSDSSSSGRSIRSGTGGTSSSRSRSVGARSRASSGWLSTTRAPRIITTAAAATAYQSDSDDDASASSATGLLSSSTTAPPAASSVTSLPWLASTSAGMSVSDDDFELPVAPVRKRRRGARVRPPPSSCEGSGEG